MKNEIKQPRVFDRYWFAKHQKTLVRIANSWLGKYIFQFGKMGHYLKHPIAGIMPNSVIEYCGVIKSGKKKGQLEFKQHFFERNEYARKLYVILYPMWLAMHLWDTIIANNFAPQLNFGFDTLTLYTDDVDVVDGWTRYWSSSAQTWATVTGNGNGVGEDASGYAFALYYTTSKGSGYTMLYRSHFLFDAGALPGGAVVSATVLSVQGYSKEDTLSKAPTAAVYTTNPASNTALAASDHQTAGTTAQSDAVTYANMGTAGYNDFTFNATGRAGISATILKYCIRCANHDAANSDPGMAAAGGYNLGIRFSNYGSVMPKLVITYSLASGGGEAGLLLRNCQ